ncbi:SH3 domain-containing protein, partial [bacterium]|nr:SH3 domain-containing protein [bacterium]
REASEGKMRRYSILFIITIALLLCTHAAEAQSVEIRVEHANARTEPSSSAPIVAVLNKGEVHLVTDDVPYWYQLELSNGQNAWVAKSLTKLVVGAAEIAPVTEPEDEEAAAENLQPLNQLYALPAFGTAVSVPGCTPTSLTVDAAVCAAEGSSSSGGQAKFWRTNQKKNRVSIECSYSQLSFDQILDLKSLPGNVRTLSSTDPRATYLQSLESQPVVVEAFLAMVKKAAKESTNCYSTSRKDLHMELIGTDQEDPKTMRNEIFVTEVSPWFSEANSSWTSTNLGQFASYRNGYSGNLQRVPAKVRIYGWLFYDDPHSSDGAVGSWRGTAWELHPITRIEVFDGGSWQVIQ